MGIQHYENGKRTDILHTFNDDIINDDWAIRSQINMGELATRLGSLQSYDNRGRQIWVDDFEAANLKWNTSLVNGGTVTLVNTPVWSGDKSAKFYLPIGNPATATLWKRLYSPLTGIYGAEITWSSSKTMWTHFKFGLIVYDGTYKWNYYLNLYGIARTFFMRQHGYGNRGVGSMTAEFSDTMFWHKWKIVADTNNGKIPRVLVDGISFDPSQYDVEHTADAADPHVYVFIEFSNVGSVDCEFYVDNFISSHLE